MKVYIIEIIDPERIEITGVYGTEDSAREAFKKMLKEYWPEEAKTDRFNQTFDECVENMMYGSPEVHITTEMFEVQM